jgi:glycosyltransferase involved in cell wall biosynthesis
MFPQAVIFTHLYDPDGVSEEFRRHEVRETFIARLPLARRMYQKYLPLMPYALEALDLNEFDLVISSESGPAKGVIPGPGALHICYCHSPMRYIWDQYNLYRDRSGPVARTAMPVVAHGLRNWDVTSAARVDRFVANSNHVANRIGKYYRRDADVVFPPVSVQDFAPVPAERGNYYLLAGELVAYKRPDLAVEAFNGLGRQLVVIGDGEERRRLEAIAGPNVTFLGRTAFDELRHHFARCRALVFPGEEDFGMVPVEVMASGRPVIAYGKGGALDTVRDGVTGTLFGTQTADDLREAVLRFERNRLEDLDPYRLVAHARRFDAASFRAGIRRVIAAGGMALPGEAA